MFLGDCPRLFDQLAEAVERRDAKAIEFSVHKLRGAAATFASSAIEEVAAELGRLGSPGNLAEASENFSALSGILEHLKMELGRFLATSAVLQR